MNDIDHHATPGLLFQWMVLTLVSLMFMAIDYRGNLPVVRPAFSMIADPIHKLVDAPFSIYERVTRFFSEQGTLVSENQQLRKQLLHASVQARDMKVLEEQNQRLREMLDVGKRLQYHFTMAEVMASSDSRGRRVVLLNKGTRHGVFEKQVVVGKNGSIFGQVIEVTPFSAKVILLTDRQHTIPVRSTRTNMMALANGTGRPNLLELKNIEPTSDVRDDDEFVSTGLGMITDSDSDKNGVTDGDEFVSSGLGELFPEGFPVAKVMTDGVRYMSDSQFVTIRAQPLLDFDDVREVLLLWRSKKTPEDADRVPVTTSQISAPAASAEPSE